VDLPANIDCLELERREDDGRIVAVKFNAVRVASIFNCDKVMRNELTKEKGRNAQKMMNYE
jgi:hypothetical protein